MRMRPDLRAEERHLLAGRVGPGQPGLEHKLSLSVSVLLIVAYALNLVFSLVTHKSLFDGSLQGFRRTDRPAFCFQGHPEASPGPHDIGYLFDRFVASMDERRA